MESKLFTFLIIFTFHLNIDAQIFGLKKLDRLKDNPNFEWITDSISNNVILYFEHSSYAIKNVETLKEKIKYHISSTLDFVDCENYDKPIHYFFVEDRKRMKRLVGWETYGTTNFKENYIVVIHSEKKKYAYMNHELFHLIAMNEWGKTERWINEGMAIFSDGHLNGYNLHQIAKYLIDNNKYIPIPRVAKKLRKYDSQITYPLLGSFVKYVEETYGRETTRMIWDVGRRRLKSRLGKSLENLEYEWLDMLDTISYKNIDYIRKSY